MRAKKISIVASICLLAAGCASPFATGSAGAGVAKTTNGGTDWVFSNKATLPSTAKKKAKQTDSPLASGSVFSLRFAPDNTKKLYAATQTNGVFLTDNAADSWSQILSDFAAYDMVIDPTNPERMFVAGRAQNQAKVLVSENGGKSWESVYTDAAVGNIARSIAIDPADSKTLVVGTTAGNLLLSRDAGTSWSLLQNFQDQVTQLVWHKNRTLFILTKSKGLYKSTDRATTIESISKPLLDFSEWQKRLRELNPLQDDTTVAEIEIPTQPTNTFYKLAVGDNPAQIFVGANNGLFSSTDGGGNWQYMKLPIRSADATEVRGLALGSESGVVFASVGNTLYKTTNAGSSWQVTAIATSATINYILVDSALPSVAYMGFIGTR